MGAMIVLVTDRLKWSNHACRRTWHSSFILIEHELLTCFSMMISTSTDPYQRSVVVIQCSVNRVKHVIEFRFFKQAATDCWFWHLTNSFFFLSQSFDDECESLWSNSQSISIDYSRTKKINWSKWTREIRMESSVYKAIFYEESHLELVSLVAKCNEIDQYCRSTSQRKTYSK